MHLSNSAGASVRACTSALLWLMDWLFRQLPAALNTSLSEAAIASRRRCVAGLLFKPRHFI